MVHLHMSLCLGNKVPLSQLGHCPWSLLCGELATQHRASAWDSRRLPKAVLARATYSKACMAEGATLGDPVSLLGMQEALEAWGSPHMQHGPQLTSHKQQLQLPWLLLQLRPQPQPQLLWLPCKRSRARS